MRASSPLPSPSSSLVSRLLSALSSHSSSLLRSSSFLPALFLPLFS